VIHFLFHNPKEISPFEHLSETGALRDIYSERAYSFLMVSPFIMLDNASLDSE